MAGRCFISFYLGWYLCCRGFFFHMGASLPIQSFNLCNEAYDQDIWRYGGLGKSGILALDFVFEGYLIP